MRPTHALRLALAAATLSLAPLAAPAAELDQAQEMVDLGSVAASNSSIGWQTFTPGVSGKLEAVELVLMKSEFCFPPPCNPTPPPFVVDVVTTSGGFPTDTVLGTATLPASSVFLSQTWVAVDFSAANVELDSGVLYALRFSSTASFITDPVVQVKMLTGLDPYAAGELFSDFNSGDGLDDPVTANSPESDFAFRTFMTGEVCGDGLEDGDETCDDGNTVGGDGCSAQCQDEACGNNVVDVGETCDDDNTVSGDGCDAECALEPAAVACQTAISRAGSRLAVARYTALQKCRNALAAGKSLSVIDPAQCASETAAARSIAKSRGFARKAIAGGNRPKCTDPLVAALAACADTVDGMVSADGTAGCLVADHDGDVGRLLESEYGY
jgi:cysteine-rich repeat protein